MTAAAKLGAFAVVLAAVLGLGAAAGAAFGPVDTGDPASTDHGGHEPDDEPAGAELPAGGLLVSQDGYSLTTAQRTLDGTTFGFMITGPDGDPVTRFDLVHERRLHLIVASRDLRHYAHLHPTMAADGSWSVQVPDLPPGAYRAIADSAPSGHGPLALGIDLTVPGSAQPPGPLVEQLDDEVDGFAVTLDPADDGTVTATVRRGDDVVTTEPYLGAAGHLVALRDGDLAYLHVHPLDEVPSGPVRFAVEVPSAGAYALFFDFQVDGVVRTARFVLDTAPAGVHAGEGHAHD